jgi:hypothetical protein
MKQQVMDAMTWLPQAHATNTGRQHFCQQMPNSPPHVLWMQHQHHTPASHYVNKGCAGLASTRRPTTAAAQCVEEPLRRPSCCCSLGSLRLAPMVTPACKSRSVTVTASVSSQRFPHHFVEGHSHLRCVLIMVMVYIHARSHQPPIALCCGGFTAPSMEISQHGRSHTL